jgi:putative membrane protein
MMGVATDNSLNQSINKAKRHYSSLFFLPSFKTAITAVSALCLIIGASTAAFFPTPEGLAIGLALGAALFLLNFFFDWVVSKKVLGDPVFVLRRTVVLSLFGWIFWFLFIVIGLALGLAFNFTLWVKLCLLGFATLLTLRTVVLFSVASATFTRRLTAILLQPLPCIVPFAIFWATHNVAVVDYLPFIVISPFVAIVFAYWFINLLDRIGQKTYGLHSIELFKTFMLNWVAALNAPLESFFEKMGADADVEVSILKFDSAKPKAAIIVPLVHPGPFKNIGSSLLPSLLKQEYEKEYGCDACVPLGLLGHELDAASQAQNHKIIRQVIHDAKFEAQLDKATPLVTVSENGVTVSCQLFGKTAFLTFTLAPKTTEDLPMQLGSIVREETERLGLDCDVVVNAHNSLTSNPEIEASLESLTDVAFKCLQKAFSQKTYPFEVGAATVYPAEFTLKDGLGTGGITAIIVKVAEQKTAYVVIDGNNMISGLREKILSALHSAGFEECEVLTTDTHAVSAVVVGQRGYHPVGEAMDQERLIARIKEVALAAAEKLEPCNAGSLRLVVPNVRLIGIECLESLTVLVDETIQKAKRIIAPIFALEGLLLILLLWLF